MSVSSKLRESTAAIHQELEKAAFGRRLAAGKVSLESYVDYLRAVAVIVVNLRTVIRRDGLESQKPLLPTLDLWVANIQEDIDFLAPVDPQANPDAQAAALKLTQAIFRRVADEPAWVFGVAYVMFGSHNGNRSIARKIKAGLGLDGDAGVSYLQSTYQDGQVWSRFKGVLEAHVIGQEMTDAVIEGAQATFECFTDIFEALGYYQERLTHSAAINPEAGKHPVPEDERTVRIADEAGRDAFRAFGYLELRYGKRGESYTRSDGAWLATLSEIPLKTALKQTDWLAKLLSARGIPSICLEFHLQSLHQALLDGEALTSEDPNRLLQLAEHVAVRRKFLKSELDWEAIIKLELPALDPLGMATLVSAIVDQRSGLANCADSMFGWLKTTNDIEPADRDQLLQMFESGDLVQV